MPTFLKQTRNVWAALVGTSYLLLLVGLYQVAIIVYFSNCAAVAYLGSTAALRARAEIASWSWSYVARLWGAFCIALLFAIPVSKAFGVFAVGSIILGLPIPLIIISTLRARALESVPGRNLLPDAERD